MWPNGGYTGSIVSRKSNNAVSSGENETRRCRPERSGIIGLRMTHGVEGPHTLGKLQRRCKEFFSCGGVWNAFRCTR
jgi:hypothetical protein